MEKRNIMVVDDQAFVCDTVTAILKSSYDIQAFYNGKDALKYLENPEHKVDLVLLDYEMPEMTGYEVLIRIKKFRHSKNTPVVFLTAETNDRMKEEMLERGASAYICKPISAPELNQCLNDFLRK